MYSDLFFPRTFLSEQLSQDVAEMLLVVPREVEEDGSWLNPDSAGEGANSMA